MKLSVIIVNYNVKFFLEQCLRSVYKALEGIASEVIVVDNNSVDSSCQMIKNFFPDVILIENFQNVGYAKANNQAIKIAKGEYILLLNPDTIVQEDTFYKCIEFMDNTPDAGALGVKMIDGKGNFLPESKRSLPRPWVAFYKIFGLSSLFPRSKIFGQYHLSYLDKNEINKVEVLCGAFMFIRKEALDKAGLLDENFFMYGEDIDLSYRIILAGYNNYYFPKTTIIHYKGESTKKGSLNYVVMFYNAMIIFAKKYFSSSKYKIFSFLIHSAIYFRAFISALKRAFLKIILPLTDFIVIYLGYLFLKPFSESIKFEGGIHYPPLFINFIVPSYIFVWITALFFCGAYDKPYRIEKVTRGVIIGTILILAIYALLPLGLRFSRLLIILGAIWSFFSLILVRYILHYLNIKDFKLYNLETKRIVIVGNKQEYERIKQLVSQTIIKADVIGFISDNDSSDSGHIGNINQLDDIIQIYRIQEIIFSSKDLTSETIIQKMLQLKFHDLEYKIAPPEGLAIIGSSSINTSGDFYLIDMNAITKPFNLRIKRLFDVILSILIILLLPILLIIMKNRYSLLKNIYKVLSGKYSWVGYNVNYENSNSYQNNLPNIKKGVLNPCDAIKNVTVSEVMAQKINFFYAKDYKVNNDIIIFLKGFRHIDRNI